MIQKLESHSLLCIQEKSLNSNLFFWTVWSKDFGSSSILLKFIYFLKNKKFHTKIEYRNTHLIVEEMNYFLKNWKSKGYTLYYLLSNIKLISIKHFLHHYFSLFSSFISYFDTSSLPAKPPPLTPPRPPHWISFSLLCPFPSFSFQNIYSY